jgi:hypothetical protein
MENGYYDMAMHLPNHYFHFLFLWKIPYANQSATIKDISYYSDNGTNSGILSTATSTKTIKKLVKQIA